jgi:hypothetical protein
VCLRLHPDVARLVHVAVRVVVLARAAAERVSGAAAPELRLELFLARLVPVTSPLHFFRMN